ncbi:MAG: thioesterase family protein [Tetrasphaera sp.]
MPTYADVVQLEACYTLVVPPEFGDANGHMNIVRYMQIHNDGGWAFLSSVGLGPEHAQAGSGASFDVEHHLRYLREVHCGDTLTLHVRMLERSAKALHVVHFLLNQSRQEIANTLEYVTVSVDLTARRVAPWPAHVAELLDARLAQDAALGWAFIGNPAMALTGSGT